MPPHPPNNCEHDQDSDHEIELMKKCLEARIFVPALTKLLTDIRQAKAPRQRPGECVDDEFLQVHARDAGGKRDEGANRRQEATDEDDDLAKPIEPAIGEIQIVMRNEQILSI